MVLASDIPLPLSSQNERRIGGNSRDVVERTHQKIAGIGHTTDNIAHPSFRDLLKRGLPIALRGDKLNIDALTPGKSIGVEMGNGALATFFIQKESPIHPQHLTTKVDHNSYFIQKDDPTHTLLLTRKYWRDGMDTRNCIFLSLNTIVDAKTDGRSTVNAVRRKIIHSMNVIMLAGTLTQCSPEQNNTTSESSYTSYESATQSGTDTYTVQPGDTLSGICRNYGNIFTVSDLKAINGIMGDVIYVDQVLTLPRAQYFQEIRTEEVPHALPIATGGMTNISSNDDREKTNIAHSRQTDAENFITMAKAYEGYKYKIGGTGTTSEAGIDCSQLVINALIGTGCIPEGSDTNTKGIQEISQKIGTKNGQPGDFLIMGGSTPHIAIITENLGGGKYNTFDASPRQKKVCENTRVAGKSYSVYRNPFIIRDTINPEVPEIHPEKEVVVKKSTKNLAESAIKESYQRQVLSAAKIIENNREKYEAVEKQTGVPWQIIAAIHYREGGLDFKTVLHNGERIIGTDKKTKKVPAGHGPFDTWEKGAIDALKTHHVTCPVNSLSLENDNLLKVAHYLKTFNGNGYDNTQGGNPYLYSGLVSPEGDEYYTTGLYTRDGHYSQKTIDKRPGAIPLLLNLLGGGSTTVTEQTHLVAGHTENTTQPEAKTTNINFTTYIRSIPVKQRQDFLRQHGPGFDISFSKNYKGTANQNAAIASLLKKNRSFREKWEASLFSGENNNGNIALN